MIKSAEIRRNDDQNLNRRIVYLNINQSIYLQVSIRF